MTQLNGRSLFTMYYGWPWRHHHDYSYLAPTLINYFLRLNVVGDAVLSTLLLCSVTMLRTVYTFRTCGSRALRILRQFGGNRLSLA